ncbi:MAG: pyruvate kinase alpha/beta domain-containing protein [Candidatus Bathyarchaeia archaeon]
MSFEEEKIIYFAKRDHSSLDKMLERVKERAEELGIRSIVVASTSGETGVKVSEIFKGYNVVIVTHHFGFREPNSIELTEENRKRILANGGKILTTTHALGGLGRAVRRKFDTVQADEIIANTLRIFGEGMKVAVEIALMAVDSGLIRTDEDVISIGKWDTAIVVRPANVSNFFNIRVKEILCKPHL